MSALLEIRQLSKVYGGNDVLANDRISMDVGVGEIVGLLGHNGAGKTTLVRQIVGLTKPTSGTIRLDGVDSVANPALARRVCSLQAQSQVPITGLTARQAIDLIGRLRGGRRRAVARRTVELAERLQIADWLDRTTRTGEDELTGGVRRLVAFCIAAIRPGRLVVLDEPTNDVDPMRRRLLWAEIRRLADEGHAVVLVTHNVAEAEHSVDRVVILHRGRIVADGAPGVLAAGMRGRVRVEIGWETVPPPLPAFISGPAHGGRRTTQTVDRQYLTELMRWGDDMRNRRRIEHFSVGTASLEDAYGLIVDAADRACESVSEGQGPPTGKDLTDAIRD